MKAFALRNYPETHRWSVTDRAAFWNNVIDRLGIVFSRRPDTVLDLARSVKQPSWLAGAELNIVDSCFKAHDDKPAVVSAHEAEPDTTVTIYGELKRLVNRIANGLREHGFERGDTIALYMPMTLQCVATYLAIIRAGLRVASIADSFSPLEVAKRCEISEARCIVTVEAYQRAGRTIQLYDKVKQAGVSQAIVISKGRNGTGLRMGDLPFDELLSMRDTFDSVVSNPNDTINVIFSSGTTGIPKAVPWTHLTPIKCAMDGHLHTDIREEDVVAWPTNIGWMMGPWLIFATLVNNATMALFEGAPNSADFTRFVANAGVTVLGVVPSLVRVWRSTEEIGQSDWTNIRVFSSTGEPSSREDSLWLMSRTGYRAPVIEYLGGTEIGGGHLTGTVVQPASPATFTTLALGIDVVVLDGEGRAVNDGETGELFLVPPAIGLSQRLFNRDHEEIYYSGCPSGPNERGPGADTATRSRALHRGYFKAQERADDTMNLGGIKVSSVELERVAENHPAVYEAAAVGARVGSEAVTKLVVFVKLSEPVEPERLQQALQQRIGRELNPLFKIHELIVVDEFPRTASNKLIRRELRTRYRSTMEEHIASDTPDGRRDRQS